MSCIEGLLREVGRDAEKELQSRLRGFLGGMLRHYLPQTWVFRTEDGTATLLVDERGAVSVAAGALAPADVTVEVGHERLRVALTSRSRTNVPPGPLNVVAHTAKGKAAFGFLRDRLGL
jgi:hypothetical protein